LESRRGLIFRGLTLRPRLIIARRISATGVSTASSKILKHFDLLFTITYRRTPCFELKAEELDLVLKLVD